MPAVSVPGLAPRRLVASKPPARHQPELANGDRLGAGEFLRRYEGMPEVKKAELINSIVYMASPVRIDLHAEADNLVQTCLGTYAAATPGTRAAANGTVRLSVDDVVQPDAFLRILEPHGGRASLDEKGYLLGPPELVIEIAASSVSIDVGEKRNSYRRAGVQEYVVWRTEDGEIDAWRLDEDQFASMAADEAGIWRSAAFPGLWLNLPALLEQAGDKLLATLQEGLASEAHAAFVKRLGEPVQP